MLFCSFFFFKQKTAYELRISDWSSDVCSSDLLTRPNNGARAPFGPHFALIDLEMLRRQLLDLINGDAARIGAHEICQHALREFKIDLPPGERGIGDQLVESALHLPNIGADITGQEINNSRSEEHTSELQSLMRISY